MNFDEYFLKNLETKGYFDAQICAKDDVDVQIDWGLS